MQVVEWIVWILACLWTAFSLIAFLGDVFAPDPFAQPADASVFSPAKIKRLISGLYVTGMAIALVLTIVWNVSKLHLLWFVPIWHFFGTNWISFAYEQRVLHKVKKIAKGTREKIYHKIYKDSEYYQEPGAFIKGGSLREIFKAIRRLGHLVIIESVYEDEYYFDIGSIKRVTKESVSLRYFDATGEWDDSNVVIDYAAITCVKYGGRYSTQWKKHLEAT